MQTAGTTRTIHATAEEVWALISDVTTISDYHPAVTSVDLLSTARSGVGASRRCHFTDGTNVKEVVTVSEPRERLRLSLSEFSMPLNRLEAETRLAPNPDGTTQVTFEVHYEVKFGLIGKALGAVVVAGKLRQMTGLVLDGIERHLADRRATSARAVQDQSAPRGVAAS